MHIIYLNDCCYINGGAAHVAIMEANAMAEKGHDVTFFASDAGDDGKRTDLGEQVKLVCLHQRELIHAAPLTATVQGIRNRKAMRELDRLLAKHDPDHTIVHLHSWEKALSAAIIEPVLARNFKLIHTAHEYSAACPNGAFYNYQSRENCGLRPMSAACISTHCDSRSYVHKLWRVSRHLVARNISGLPARLKHFIFPSKFTAEIVGPYLSEDTDIHVLANGIDMEKKPPADVANNQEFYFVGRISPEKGVEHFLEASSRLNISPVLVGDGPIAGRMRQEYPGADFRPWMDKNQLLSEMRQARALVFPSVWYENDPLIVKEALAMGIPVITSDACAARNTIIDGVTGLHFESGNVTDLANKIKSLADDPGFAADLGKTAYERFWDDPPTITRHCEKLEEYYRSVLFNNGA